MKNQWSPWDEQELQALVKRKQAFESEARAPLNKLIADMKLNLGFEAPTSAPTEPYPKRIADAFIARADALRDALAPFDSGVRCGSAG